MRKQKRNQKRGTKKRNQKRNQKKEPNIRAEYKASRHSTAVLLGRPTLMGATATANWDTCCGFGLVAYSPATAGCKHDLPYPPYPLHYSTALREAAQRNAGEHGAAQHRAGRGRADRAAQGKTGIAWQGKTRPHAAGPSRRSQQHNASQPELGCSRSSTSGFELGGGRVCM